MSDADSIEDLRKQSERSDRVSAATDEQTTLEDDFLEHFAGVRDGSESGQVAIRDDRLTAFANTMVDRPDDLNELVEQLESELDATPEVQLDSKAGVFALLARIGLKEAAPNHHEMLEEAVGTYAKHNL